MALRPRGATLNGVPAWVPKVWLCESTGRRPIMRSLRLNGAANNDGYFRMTRRLATVFAFLIFTSPSVMADTEAVAVNGKRVLLKDDHSWEYIKNTPPDNRYARLSVEFTESGAAYCRVGLRLKNDLADKITSIIFMFSAYVDEEVRYETVTKGFQHLKPTNDRFNEITFSGLPCDDIDYIRVHGADRCEVGELNKFTSAKGQCLKLVQVHASDKIVIFKRYENDVLPTQNAKLEEESVNTDESVEERWARELEQKESGVDEFE